MATDLLNSAERRSRARRERVGPSVVGLGRGWGLGSGVVIGEGHVLTNAHNLRREQVTVAFADGRRETGEVAAADPDLDLAVLEVDTGDAPAVAWEPGERARDRRAGARRSPTRAGAACGRRSASCLRRAAASAARAGAASAARSSTRAPLPRGSSGGPLVDAEGRLLGLNALRLEGGLILAVPATAAVTERAMALARGEAPATARLGVAVAPPRAARRMRRAVGLPERDGLLVRAVEDGRPGGRGRHRARRPARGRRAARELDGVDALYEVLDGVSPGGALELTVVRGHRGAHRDRRASRRRGGGVSAVSKTRRRSDRPRPRRSTPTRAR